MTLEPNLSAPDIEDNLVPSCFKTSLTVHPELVKEATAIPPGTLTVLSPPMNLAAAGLSDLFVCSRGDLHT